ncbi:hypothetical protein [Pseudomonas carnis]|uniref:hypothetical protein n=1 Tax=Pseudomonas carnis TaxID=2487355 RepID=UPI00244A3DD3|nr:hypothetical protein [Pseudomonas carnis]MDH0797529.1 hypothetical protein [Pseudomonas carnis]
MAEELVAHVCKICGSAWPKRKKAKLHVNLKHLDRVYAQHGPGQHVDYLWLDLEHWRRP